jgi:hypothetical protein
MSQHPGIAEPVDWSSVEHLLQQWHDRAHAREITNFGAANSYRTRHMCLGGALVALSALMATAAGKSMTASASAVVKIVADLVVVAIPVLAGLQTFLRFGEQAEKHRTIAAKYGSIKREIEELLALDTHARGDQKKAVDGIRSRLDTVEAEEPQIPRKLWEQTGSRPMDRPPK